MSNAQRPHQYGIEDSEEQKERHYIRDVRPLYIQIHDALKSREMGAFLTIFLAVSCITFPAYCDLFLLFGFYLRSLRARSTRYARLPLRIPKGHGGKDYSKRAPGGNPGEFIDAGGIFFLGNTKWKNEELWLTSTDLCTHTLVFGTTGSGKTYTLLSMSFNALAIGSGLCYVDPKADPKFAHNFFSIARYVGRDDDVRVKSFLTAGKGSLRTPKRMTNTNNPFAFGSAESLTNLLSSLIPKSEGDNANFSQNAQTLISGLMYALVELRDRGELQLGIKAIREHMLPDNYAKLATDPSYKLSEEAVGALKNFLQTVGYQFGKKNGDSFYKQYGFARSYFGLALASLVDAYGQVYAVEYGEIDYRDVLLNRRLLISLLPSLSVSEQECANLGKIELSGLKTAASVGLGDRLEGTSDDVLGSLPADARSPHLIIVDEYAAINTPGFVLMFTQARSLNFAAIIGTQDFSGLKKADAEEAGQVLANTNIKIFLKTIDESTFEVGKKIASEAKVMRSEAHEIKTEGNLFGDYRDSRRGRLESAERFHFRDLKNQVEGECHILVDDSVIRGRCFTAVRSLGGEDQLRLRRMVRVPKPNPKKLSYKRGATKQLADFLREIEEPITCELDKHSTEFIDKLADCFESSGDSQGIDLSIATYVEMVNWLDSSSSMPKRMKRPLVHIDQKHDAVQVEPKLQEPDLAEGKGAQNQSVQIGPKDAEIKEPTDPESGKKELDVSDSSDIFLSALLEAERSSGSNNDEVAKALEKITEDPVSEENDQDKLSAPATEKPSQDVMKSLGGIDAELFGEDLPEKKEPEPELDSVEGEIDGNVTQELEEMLNEEPPKVEPVSDDVLNFTVDEFLREE